MASKANPPESDPFALATETILKDTRGRTSRPIDPKVIAFVDRLSSSATTDNEGNWKSAAMAVPFTPEQFDQFVGDLKALDAKPEHSHIALRYTKTLNAEGVTTPVYIDGKCVVIIQLSNRRKRVKRPS